MFALPYSDDPPTCESCELPRTVNHTLVEWTCGTFVKNISVSSVRELFESVENHTVTRNVGQCPL